MTAARRLAAILAADVVGYSRLMGEDEAGTARAVSERREAARPIVADHGGRIVKTTGDGLLLEFPSVVAAVECAIAIQKLMAERNAEHARRQAHPLSHRRQPRRRPDRGRRHSRRRRQYRGAARKHLRARRNFHLQRRLRACERPGRGAFRRSRREGPEKHRAAGAGLYDQTRLGKRSARSPPRRTSRGRRASPSWCCRSPTCPATRIRSISSMA